MDTTYSPHTRNDRKLFTSKYEYFASFLLVLLDCDLEGKTLQTALSDWLHGPALIYDSRRKIVEEGRAFLQQQELPWTVVEDVSNYLFGSKEEAFTWLSDALDQIEATLRD